MSGNVNVKDDLFFGGPLLRWERSLRLVKPGRPLVARRTLLAVLIGWLPLAVLTAVQLLISADESAKSFVSDFAVHARFLVAVPALILAEAECIPRLERIVNHFAEAGLVVESDTARFQAAVSSTRRLLDSTISDLVTLVLVYLVVAALALYISPDALPTWQIHHGAQPLEFKNLVIGLLVFLLILFAGPLTIFFKKLRETKRRGVFEYGALAGAVGTQFEAQWIRQTRIVDETSLEVPDFSTTTDLYAVTANVYEMKEVPFSFRDLIGPIGVSALLPFLPLALLAVPLEVILRGLVKLLF